MEVRALGALEVVVDGHVVPLGGPKERALLALLAVHRGPCSQDRLIDYLWGDDPPLGARKTLQTYVWRLRNVLPDGAIINTAGGYQLSTADESDIVRFEHLISQASGAITAGEARRASDLYRDALQLWRGEPFGGCAGVDPLQARRTWLEELHSQAVEGRLDAELRLGHHGDLIGELEHHVQTAPLRERLWEMLALALYRSGRQADALRACRRARDRLVGELGLEPGARLAALERSILAQDPSLEGDASAMDPHRRTRTGSQGGTRSSQRASADPSALFAGRSAELEALRIWWQSDPPHSLAAIVLGEAGIGKSTLISRFADEVGADGTRVLIGRAAQGSGSLYEPLLGVLRQFVAEATDDEMKRLSETAAGSLARLVPEMAMRRPDAAAAAQTWGEVDRSWLLGSVADAVARDGSPSTLLVLDDLQWADRPAILLLLRLLEPGRGVRIIGTYRHPGLSVTTDLARLLAELGRASGPILRISIEGLTSDDVVDIMRAHAGAELPPEGIEFARLLHRQTGGNPLFITQAWRHLLATSSVSPSDGHWPADRVEAIGTYGEAKDAVQLRLSELSPTTRRVLQTAGVIGVEFDVDVVATAAECSDDDVMAAIEEALSAGLVSEHQHRVDSFLFVHALVSEVLVEELSRSRRARLEWRVGEALTALRPHELDDRAGEIAGHLVHGAAVGDPRMSVEWAQRAGAQAFVRAGYEDAERYFEMALTALDACATDDVELRAELLIALGRAANDAGNPALWRTSSLGAAQIARQTGDPERLARAAIGLLGTLSWGTDETVLDVIQSAIDLLVAGEPTPARSALHGELLTRLSTYLATPDPRRAAVLAGEALEIARRAGDDRVLTLALLHSLQLQPLDRSEQRTRLDQASTSLHSESDTDIVLAVHTERMVHALAWADRAEYDSALIEYARRAQRSRAATPVVMSTVNHAGAAALEGRYDEADALFEAALRSSQQLGDPRLPTNINQGRYAVLLERPELTAQLIEQLRHSGEVRGIQFTRLLAEFGEHQEAHTRLQATLERKHHERGWYLHTYMLSVVAETAAILGDRDLARIVYDLLTATRSTAACVTVGAHCYLGAIERYLGLLSFTMGHAHDAVEQHERALALHERMRAHGWAARSRHDLSRALLLRRLPGDSSRAETLAIEARATAALLKMPKLLRELDANAPPESAGADE